MDEVKFYFVSQLINDVFRVIIDTEKYPALKDLPLENMKCTFEEEGFYFEAFDPRSNEKYALAMPRTREKIFPDKSKYYVRKNKIYIALHKQVGGAFETKFHYFLRKKKIGGHSKKFKENLIL